jgi:hypothetical protein
MPGKLRSFNLPDATIDQLDVIARSMPKGPTGLPATRTDALMMSVAYQYDIVKTRSHPQQPPSRTLPP